MRTEEEIKRKLATLRGNSPCEEEKMKGWEAALKWISGKIEVEDGNINLSSERLEAVDTFPLIENGLLWINLKGLKIAQYIQDEAMDVENISIRLGDILDLIEDYKKEARTEIKIGRFSTKI